MSFLSGPAHLLLPAPPALREGNPPPPTLPEIYPPPLSPLSSSPSYSSASTSTSISTTDAPPLPQTLTQTFCTFANPLPLSGHGTLLLTTTALTFTLHPLPPQLPSPAPVVTLALDHIALASLTIRTPLLRPPHVAGVADGAHFTLEPTGDGEARELLDCLRVAVREASERAEREGWVMRMIEAGEAGEDGEDREEGVAFFDPKSPKRLVLAQRMGKEELRKTAMALVE